MEKKAQQKIEASYEIRRTSDDDSENEIRVIPIHKRVHAKNPGSSPE